jgi:hypothetical protein
MALSKITNDGVTGLSIDSSGLVTMANSVFMTRFYLASNHTTNAVVTGWTGSNHNAEIMSIGTAVTHSSGNFTFPITGIWRITVQGRIQSPNNDPTISVYINITTDNSTYTRMMHSGAGDEDSGTSSVFIQNYINVNDVTNVKAQIEVGSIGTGSYIQGQSSGPISPTQVTFERITDSQ